MYMTIIVSLDVTRPNSCFSSGYFLICIILRPFLRISVSLNFDVIDLKFPHSSHWLVRYGAIAFLSDPTNSVSV